MVISYISYFITSSCRKISHRRRELATELEQQGITSSRMTASEIKDRHTSVTMALDWLVPTDQWAAANVGNLKLPARMLVPGLVSPRRLAGCVALWTGMVARGPSWALECLDMSWSDANGTISFMMALTSEATCWVRSPPHRAPLHPEPALLEPKITLVEARVELQSPMPAATEWRDKRIDTFQLTKWPHNRV